MGKSIPHESEIDNTRKHMIPQFYLKGFSAGKRRIYAFDKKHPELGVKIQLIKKTAVSKLAYSAENDDELGRREQVWSLLLQETLPKSASFLNKAIADREYARPFRETLAMFVLDSIARSPGMRDRIEKPLRDGLEDYWAFWRQQIDVAGVHSGVPTGQVQSVLEGVRAKFHPDRYPEWSAIYLKPFLPEEHISAYALVADGIWRFLEAPEGRGFITADIPAICWDYRFFSMPLSRKLLLEGVWGDARQESAVLRDLAMDDEAMTLVNRRMFQNAERWVYASSEGELHRFLGAE
ncbi:MAG: DUF4238 domain-containing protein [Chloroflexi bacterium]|nr:DUF4238 domain-containing protein [Chloroflexota bacterium]